MNWFNQLPRRDQSVLIVGAIFVSLILVWVLLLDPLAKSVQQHTNNYENAKRNLAEVKKLVAEYQQYQSSGGPQSGQPNSSLDALVTRVLNQNQLSYTRKNPSGNDRVNIRFDEAKYENIVQWLYEVEVMEGVQVESLTLAATEKSGYVAASVNLKR